MKTIPSVLTLAAALLASVALAQTPVFPVQVDTSHADPVIAKELSGYFLAKSRHDVDKTMSYVDPDLLTYTDSTVGWPLDGFAALKGTFAKFMPQWPPTGLSYPVRILGGPHSALVEFIDTKELFGGELHVFGAVDFKGNKVHRWVDYWDGNTLDAKIYASLRTPEAGFPRDFKDAAVGMQASARMIQIANKLQNALAAGKAQAAAALFSNKATLDDLTLHTTVAARPRIAEYLSRAIAHIPYGAGSRVRHVVGGDQGGGIEWFAASSFLNGHGVTAIELDRQGKITRASIVYDGRQIAAEKLATLTALSTAK